MISDKPVCGDRAQFESPEYSKEVVCSGPSDHIGYHQAQAGGSYIYRWMMPAYPVWRMRMRLRWRS
jgi:hypothetical protein